MPQFELNREPQTCRGGMFAERRCLKILLLLLLLLLLCALQQASAFGEKLLVVFAAIIGVRPFERLPAAVAVG
jgi:hypothetical protein